MDLITINEFYLKDKDSQEYVKRYCTKHKTTPEVALKHVLVQEVIKQYMGGSNGKR